MFDLNVLWPLASLAGFLLLIAFSARARKAEAERNKAREEVARLRRALEWFADNWRIGMSDYMDAIRAKDVQIANIKEALEMAYGELTEPILRGEEWKSLIARIENALKVRP